jgi:hypothetical protein
MIPAFGHRSLSCSKIEELLRRESLLMREVYGKIHIIDKQTTKTNSTSQDSMRITTWDLLVYHTTEPTKTKRESRGFREKTDKRKPPDGKKQKEKKLAGSCRLSNDGRVRPSSRLETTEKKEVSWNSNKHEETDPKPNLSRKEDLGNRHPELAKAKKKDEERVGRRDKTHDPVES